jgi:DNA repair protein RadC
VSSPLAVKTIAPSALQVRVTNQKQPVYAGGRQKRRITVNQSDANSLPTLDLLERLSNEMPEIFGQAQVVGRWVWLEFNVPPVKQIREKLKELGFHWNAGRKCWQHPCGVPSLRAGGDPRSYYQVKSATEMAMNDAPALPAAMEYKVVALRECPLPESLAYCDTPDRAAEYWRLHVQTNPYFNPECECFVILILNTRRRAKGHQLLTIGTMDTLLVHPREVFRAAIIASASAVVLMHNHPSGESTPSDADIKVTRDLIRAGQLLKIEVLDHVIMGNPNYSSLRELGYFS